MTVATFCGHSDSVQTKKLRDWLVKVAQSLIAGGIDTFYLGGYGAFDRLAAGVMREMKKGDAALGNRRVSCIICMK